MRTKDLVGVFDGAEVLFCACQDLGHVAHQPVAVFAVGAMELLNEIEIPQVMAVEHEIVATPHSGNTVDGKAGPLVEADTGINHEHWNHHAVNDWPGDQVLWPVGHQPSEKVGLELAMRLLDRMLKLHALAFDLEENLALMIMDGAAQLGFERSNLVQNCMDLIVHMSKYGPIFPKLGSR